MTLTMVLERQRYVSSLLKNIGSALFVPASTIAFQFLVFGKAYFVYVKECVLVFFIGWIFIISGFIVLKEKK